MDIILYRKVFNNKYLKDKIFKFVQYREWELNYDEYEMVKNSKNLVDIRLSNLVKGRQIELFNYFFDIFINKSNSNNNNQEFYYYHYDIEERELLKILKFKELELEKLKILLKFSKDYIINKKKVHPFKILKAISKSGNLINFNYLFGKQIIQINNNNGYKEDHENDDEDDDEDDDIRNYLSFQNLNNKLDSKYKDSINLDSFSCGNSIEIYQLLVKIFEYCKFKGKENQDYRVLKLSNKRLNNLYDSYLNNLNFNSDLIVELINISLNNEDFKLAKSITTNSNFKYNQNQKMNLILKVANDYNLNITDKYFKILKHYLDSTCNGDNDDNENCFSNLLEKINAPINNSNHQDKGKKYYYKLKLWSDGSKKKNICVDQLFNGLINSNYLPNSLEEMKKFGDIKLEIQTFTNITTNILDLNFVKHFVNLFENKFYQDQETYKNDYFKLINRCLDSTYEISNFILECPKRRLFFEKEFNPSIKFIEFPNAFFGNIEILEMVSSFLSLNFPKTKIQNRLNMPMVFKKSIEKDYFQMVKFIISKFYDPVPNDTDSYVYSINLYNGLVTASQYNQYEIFKYIISKYTIPYQEFLSCECYDWSNLTKNSKYFHCFLNYAKESYNTFIQTQLFKPKDLISNDEISNNFQLFKMFYYDREYPCYRFNCKILYYKLILNCNNTKILELLISHKQTLSRNPFNSIDKNTIALKIQLIKSLFYSKNYKNIISILKYSKSSNQLKLFKIYCKIIFKFLILLKYNNNHSDSNSDNNNLKINQILFYLFKFSTLANNNDNNNNNDDDDDNNDDDNNTTSTLFLELIYYSILLKKNLNSNSIIIDNIKNSIPSELSIIDNLKLSNFKNQCNQSTNLLYSFNYLNNLTNLEINYLNLNGL